MRTASLLLIASLCGAGFQPADPASAGSSRANARPQTQDPCPTKTCLRADFDGDGKPDRAVLTTAPSGARGITIYLSSRPEPVVLGAGKVFHYMKNLDFTSWRVKPHASPQHRDALVLEWESASGLVYWNGSRFIWRQLGD